MGLVTRSSVITSYSIHYTKLYDQTRIGSPPDALRDALDSLVEDGKLLRERNRIRLPDHLFFVSNEILAVLA